MAFKTYARFKLVPLVAQKANASRLKSACKLSPQFMVYTFYCTCIGLLQITNHGALLEVVGLLEKTPLTREDLTVSILIVSWQYCSGIPLPIAFDAIDNWYVVFKFGCYFVPYTWNRDFFIVTVIVDKDSLW